MVIAFASLLSLFFVLGGVLSCRLGLLPFGVSFSIFGLGLVACAMLAMVSAALIFRRLARKQVLARLPLWLILCSLPVVLVVNRVGLDGFQAPPIHDISTDLIQPPVFVFAQAERGPGDNSLEHGGEPLAAQQRLGYPQLGSLRVEGGKAEVWRAAMAVITANNWRLLGEDEMRGHIEAVATTRLMAFADDIVIRISPENLTEQNKQPLAKGVVVDMRSVSRLGVSDLGANAARIEAFFKALQDQLASQ